MRNPPPARAGWRVSFLRRGGRDQRPAASATARSPMATDRHPDAAVHHRHRGALVGPQHRERRGAVRPVHALPALHHAQTGAQGLRGQVEQRVVHRFVVERQRVLPVMVRVPDDEFAVGRGADKQVDAVLEQHGRAGLDHLAQRARRGQVGKRAVVHAGQAREQRPVQRHRARFERRAQHLQPGHFQAQRREKPGQHGQVIVAGAHEHVRALELPGAGFHPALRRRARQRAGDEPHAQRLGQVARDGRQRLAGIDLQVVLAAQGRAMVREPAVIQPPQLAGRQQLGAVAFLPQARFGELRQHVGLLRAARQHQTAVGAHVEPRVFGEFQPQLAGLLRMRKHEARRLARHDHLAEIADRGAMRLPAALDHGNRKATARRRPGVRDAQHACAHHDYVKSLHFALHRYARKIPAAGGGRGGHHFFFGSDLPS